MPINLKFAIICRFYAKICFLLSIIIAMLIISQLEYLPKWNFISVSLLIVCLASTISYVTETLAIRFWQNITIGYLIPINNQEIRQYVKQQSIITTANFLINPKYGPEGQAEGLWTFKAITLEPEKYIRNVLSLIDNDHIIPVLQHLFPEKSMHEIVDFITSWHKPQPFAHLYIFNSIKLLPNYPSDYAPRQAKLINFALFMSAQPKYLRYAYWLYISYSPNSNA